MSIIFLLKIFSIFKTSDLDFSKKPIMQRYEGNNRKRIECDIDGVLDLSKPIQVITSNLNSISDHIIHNLSLKILNQSDELTIFKVISSISKIKRIYNLHISTSDRDMISLLIQNLNLFRHQMKLTIESNFELDPYEIFKFRKRFNNFKFIRK